MTQPDKLVEARKSADEWRREWANCQGEHTALVQAFQRAMNQAADERQEMWRLIETAPVGEDLLLAWTCQSSGQACVSLGIRDRHGRWLSESDGLIEPTHWQPLPEPPPSKGGM